MRALSGLVLAGASNATPEGLAATKTLDEFLKQSEAADEAWATALENMHSQPSSINQNLKALLKTQEKMAATSTAASDAYKAAADAEYAAIDEYEANKPTTTPGDEQAQASELSATMGAADCECAAQLYGSTTTTADTSVPGALIQKSSDGSTQTKASIRKVTLLDK